MISIRSALALSLSLVLLGACTKDRTVAAAPSIELTNLEALPEPDFSGATAITPLETLEIRVLEAELLTGTYTVDERGFVRFPFVGDVKASGLSTTQFADNLENALRGEYLLDPQIVVQSQKDLKSSISIGGEVKSPGTFEAVRSRTLLRAINNAGGLSRSAQSDDVLIMRTVNGQDYIGVYNMAAIERGNYADPRVYPDDIIMVGESPSRRFLENVLAYTPLLTTSVFLIDRVTR